MKAMPSVSDPRNPSHALLATMPARYRDAFAASEVREHAAIVARRVGAPVHIEAWKPLPNGGAVVCVVADDQPGLLAFISAALVVQGLDVGAAKAFTRHAAKGRAAEAIDFLWVHRDGLLTLPVLRGDVARIGEVLRDLVTGQVTLDSVIRRARTPFRKAPPGASTRIKFEESPEASLVVLTVETSDGPGLLLAVTQALFRAGVQIVTLDATTQNGRVVDQFTIVELNGKPIVASRRGLVQMEVLAAIGALARGELAS